jgi:hypothetical protein
MEQSPSWETNSLSASQEIPRLCGNRRFITVFTKARQFREPCLAFHNELVSYGDEFLAPSPTFKLKNHPLSAVREWYSICSQLPSVSGGRSSIRNPKKLRVVRYNFKISHGHHVIVLQFV